jgi:hypothetical protein
VTVQFKVVLWQALAAPVERDVTRIMTTPDIALEFSSALRASLREYRRRTNRLIPNPLGDEER